MLNKGELVRIKGYHPDYDGIEGYLDYKNGTEERSMCHIIVTKSRPKAFGYKVNEKGAMWYGNLERVARPEEMIPENWN